MSTTPNQFKVDCDLSNHYQLNEAAGQVYNLAARGFNGSIASMLMSGYGYSAWHFIPDLDGRRAVMQKLRKAESAMFKAITAFDVARAEAVAFKQAIKGGK